MFVRAEYQEIKSRLEEPRRFIQVISGPRQVGKTTVVEQVLSDISIPYRAFVIGTDGVPIEEFLLANLDDFFSSSHYVAISNGVILGM